MRVGGGGGGGVCIHLLKSIKDIISNVIILMLKNTFLLFSFLMKHLVLFILKFKI